MTTTKQHVETNLDDLVASFIREFDHDTLLAYCREYEVETNFDTTLDDGWPDETDRCATELAAAMVKAYENDAIKLKTDAERFQWLLANPDNSRHLFLLLSQEKGDANAFITMLDRIIESEIAAGANSQ